MTIESDVELMKKYRDKLPDKPVEGTPKPGSLPVSMLPRQCPECDAEFEVKSRTGPQTNPTRRFELCADCLRTENPATVDDD